jgi:hypothetical protein
MAPPAALVCCCLVAKISSTRLRIKTVTLKPNCCNNASIATNFLNNPILTGLRGKGGLYGAVRLYIPVVCMGSLPSSGA